MAETRYSEEHEWIRVEGDVGTVGITNYAQEQLGDVVFVDVPAVGRKVAKGESIAVVESVKAASDVYAPISGIVIEANDELPNSPNAINEDPYGDGWLVRIQPKSQAEIEELMSAEDYEELVAGLTD